MRNDFYMDKTELRRLQKTFKQSPKLLRPVTANVINSLAFDINGEIIDKERKERLLLGNPDIQKINLLIKESVKELIPKQKIQPKKIKKGRANSLFVTCHKCHNQFLRIVVYEIRRGQTRSLFICKECYKNFEPKSPNTVIISPKR